MRPRAIGSLPGGRGTKKRFWGINETHTMRNYQSSRPIVWFTVGLQVVWFTATLAPSSQGGAASRRARPSRERPSQLRPPLPPPTAQTRQ